MGHGRARPAQAVSEAGQTAASVANLPTSTNFVLSDPGLHVPADRRGQRTARPPYDSRRRWLNRSRCKSTAQARPRSCPRQSPSTSTPSANTWSPPSIPARRSCAAASPSLHCPPWIIVSIGEDFNEVMAYPKIDLPMYKPLRTISRAPAAQHQQDRAEQHHPDGDQPALHRSPTWWGSTTSLPASCCGASIPTDQRGSYFRQFWAVDRYIDSEGLSQNALQGEALRHSRNFTGGRSLNPLGDQQQPRRSAEPVCLASSADYSRRTAEEVSQHRHLRATRQDGERPACA